MASVVRNVKYTTDLPTWQLMVARDDGQVIPGN